MIQTIINLGLVSIIGFCGFNIIKLVKELHIGFYSNDIKLCIKSVGMHIKPSKNRSDEPSEGKRHTLILLLLANILTAFIVSTILFWSFDWKIPLLVIFFFYLLVFIFYKIHDEL